MNSRQQSLHCAHAVISGYQPFPAVSTGLCRPGLKRSSLSSTASRDRGSSRPRSQPQSGTAERVRRVIRYSLVRTRTLSNFPLGKFAGASTVFVYRFGVKNIGFRGTLQMLLTSTVHFPVVRARSNITWSFSPTPPEARIAW